MSSVTYPVLKDPSRQPLIDDTTYQQWYKESIETPEVFWKEQASIIDWFKPFTKTKNTSFTGDVSIKWFEDGETNVSYNCIDRHLKTRGDQVAIIWESDDPSFCKNITYKELHKAVCQVANVMKKHGVKKGDRVTIYMPMIPEAAYAMLACTRIGAIHSVVFGGFSPEALAGRIVDCKSKFLITADESVRAGKHIPLKTNADKAIEIAKTHGFTVEKTMVVRRTGGDIPWYPERDIRYIDEIKTVSDDCPPEKMNAEDPLFILYTSGSTGTPKGVLHTTGGYLVYAAVTHKYIFDHHEKDIYFCTADIGWITGHTYTLYGPLANGGTTLMFAGVPNYPDHGRFWDVINKHKATTFYTAPTAIRALMANGDNNFKCPSLRLLGSVGEPINPEAWEWYYHVVGKDRCPIVDTWWQTETGGILITPLPGATNLKPGSATRPFFGVRPELLDANGKVLEGAQSGNLCIADSWPGQMRTLYGDHKRFIANYFTAYPGKYFTSDGVRRDEDGYYWITGRVDDVLNVSGHRLGTAELESALGSHNKVSEAAVVGYPHELKGQGIYAYVTLMDGVEATEELKQDIIKHIRAEIGPIAKPDAFQFAKGLPKTRSGKIMRRILRKIAEDDFGSLGDTSTLADPSVVDDLIDNRQNKHK